MGKMSISDVSVLEDDLLSWLKELTLVEPHLEKAPFAKFGGDIVMGTNNPSIEDTNPICNKPVDLAPTSPLLLPTSPSLAYLSCIPR